MSYIINSTRLTRVRIGGVDLTDRVVDITLSDSSGVKNGLIATDGEIKLGFRPGSPDRQDYKRNTFVRGERVKVFITYPSGREELHPRGDLYVIDSIFDPQDESISINVGCKMAIAALDGDISALDELGELYLPDTRKEYSAISSKLASEGLIAWYDNSGSLQVDSLFSGETDSTSPEAEWVSVFGVTAQAISALDKTRSIKRGGDGDGTPYDGGDPDNIELSYEYVDGLIDPETGDVDPEGDPLIETTTSVSDYFTQYPAIFYKRVPAEPDEEGEPDLDTAGDPEDDEGLEEPRPQDCIDQPAESDNPASTNPDSGGAGNGDTNCMDNWETLRVPLYVGVRATSETVTTFTGPGGQRDNSVTIRTGPALEANSQYIGDIYQLCRQSWATRCNPNGYCSTAAGTKTVELEKTIQNTLFNEDGSVFQEITDSYVTRASAAQPSNWRSGVEDGKIIGFRYLSNAYSLFRVNRQIVEYEYPKNGTLRKTTNYASVTTRGQGLPYDMSQADALNGIVTKTVDRSRNNQVNADLPETAKSPEPETVKDVSEIGFPNHDKLLGEGATDGLTFKETMPYPIMISTGSTLTLRGVLETYENYLRRCIKGQSLGLRVGEAMREEIGENWKPNVSFRYFDPRYNTLISMRGDAHTWSITPESCSFSVDGLAQGFSNGEVEIPDNVVGNATAILP